jgi:hypothetical protein
MTAIACSSSSDHDDEDEWPAELLALEEEGRETNASLAALD